jgi:WXXGXW repeat (2 copies)
MCGFLRHNGVSGCNGFGSWGKIRETGMNRNRAAVRALLLAIVVLSFSAASFSQIAVGISVRVGPPALPVYAQPICPGPGYFWTPGYWGWNDDAGYYWVPGTWVVAPVGMLWTPGYWGWGGGFYAWHAGYWGPHIGFYGGINYGFGYTGVGFVGGEWRGGAFYYNRSVTNVSVTNVTNVYNRTVVVNNTRTVSYNGGQGGIEARPTPQEEAAAREHHEAPLATQVQHEHAASQNRQNFASENHGRPAIAATARPGDLSSHSAVPARAAGGEYHPPAMSPKEARVNSTPANRGNSEGGFRPFTKPNSTNSSPNNAQNHGSAGNQNRGSSPNSTYQEHGYSGQGNTSHPAQPRQSSPPQHSSPPPQQHHSSPPPPKQSAPKQEHPKGR